MVDMLKKEKFIEFMSLKSIRGLGNKKTITIIKSFEEAHLIFDQATNNSKSSGILSKDILNELKDTIAQKSKEFGRIYDYCARNKIEILSYFDQEYPDKLRCITNPPLLLFLKGDLSLLNSELIAVVGSRKSSNIALDYAFKISKSLSENGFVVVSGGAVGIDTFAHKGALEHNGKTICVLATGFNKIYPVDNIELFKDIEKRGLLISEYEPDNGADRFSFLERNRITSGLSDYVFIVSSSLDGGTMSQFKHAYAQGKIIFSPDKTSGLEPFDGISKLIKERKILPVKGATDLLAEICRAKKKRCSQAILSNLKSPHAPDFQLMRA